MRIWERAKSDREFLGRGNITAFGRGETLVHPSDIGRSVRILSTGETGQLVDCAPPDGFVVYVQLHESSEVVMTGNTNVELEN